MEMTLTIEAGGRLTLPSEVLARYGLQQNTPLRIIQTQSGILFIPLTGEPMSDALKSEIESWQDLSLASLSELSEFPYEEGDESA